VILLQMSSADGLGHNRVCTYDGAVADHHARQHCYVTAEPHIVAYDGWALVHNGTGFNSMAVIINGRPVMLASKFAPFRHRVTAAQLASALDKTLERLGRDSLGLY